MNEGTAGDPDGWVARPAPGGGVRIEQIPARMLIGQTELDDMTKSGRFGEISTSRIVIDGEAQTAMHVTASNGVWIYDMRATDVGVWEATLIERRPVRVPVNRGKP